jgi:eukaryotic-like serine/threonine-protein kinase
MARSPDARTRGARLTWRLFVAVGSVVGAVLLGNVVLVSVAAQRTADVAIAHGLDRTTHLVSVLLEGRDRSLARAAGVFVQNPSFRSLLIDGRPEDLFDQSIEAEQRTGATWVQIADDYGTRLAKSDEPTAPNVPLSGSALIGGALQGKTVTGFGASGDSLLFQAVAVPIAISTADTSAAAGLIDRVYGVLMAAQAIDSALADEVKRTTDSDVVFFVVDTAGAPHIAASTLGRSRELAAALSRDIRPAPDDSVDATSSIGLEIEGVQYVGRTAPLRSAGGEILGGFVALRSRDAETAPFDALRRWIGIAGILGLGLAFALSYLMARSVARPVLALARATRRVAEGDYSAAVDVHSNDEIGTLADAVRTMLADLREKEALVGVLQASTGSGASPVTNFALPPATSSETVAPGHVLAGRYAIVEVLGAGGAGVVYKALDQELGELVAIKTMLDGTLADETAIERLKNEIRLARRIAHRNVVRTHDLGEANGIYFISMEYVHGTSLRALIDREGILPVPATFSIAKQLCRALDVAHNEGIIHRDIKPQNLMVQADGTLKVMDFGVARLVQRTSALTQVGMVVGTPQYMAPEQLLDEPVDVRADLYAAGVVLYECLTGDLPFVADTAFGLISRKLSSIPPAPHELNTDVPRQLSDLVMRVLARDPDTRPARAIDLYDLLVLAEPQL